MVENDTKACCKYCGQVLLFNGSACSCEGALIERSLLAAQNNIEQAFGAECSSKGLIPCTEEQIELLKGLAGLIIAEQVVNASLALSGGTRARISLNSKGGCVIRRTESSEIKLEG